METKKKTSKTKLKSISELESKYFGKKGSAGRETYEMQVRVDIIGEILKQSRVENKMTQSQLAKKLGMDKTYLSKIENNLKTQRLDTLIKVLKALHGSLFIRLTGAQGIREIELI